MKFINDFEAFLRAEVNLNQTRLDCLQQSVDAIQEFLSEHEVFRSIFLDVIPAGSWAHRTIIRPVQENDEFDADILLYVKERIDWQPKDYLEELWLAFQSTRRYKLLAQRKTRCIRINYAGEFHIDVVPYLERAGRHYITNRCEPEGIGRFEASDPEAFTNWIDERQRLTNGNFIKTVRLIKYLRDFKNTFECKSIILLTLLGEQVNTGEAGSSPELYADVPSTLVTLLGKLAETLPDTIPAIFDPAGTGENFSDRYKEDWNYTNFRNRMIYYADQVRAAFDEKNREISIAKWRGVFGDEFKSEVLSKKALGEPFRASVPWADEQFINQPPYDFPLRLIPTYQVHITGRVRGLAIGQATQRNGFRQFELSKQGNRVPKQRRLQFTITSNVPGPYRVYWKVRNGGREANEAKALRGEISKDQGSRQKIESTLYAGQHYVECYIVKDNVVVAQDRQEVIVSKNL
jgi:hypothetical protein